MAASVFAGPGDAPVLLLQDVALAIADVPVPGSSHPLAVGVSWQCSLEGQIEMALSSFTVKNIGSNLEPPDVEKYGYHVCISNA